MTRAHKLTAFIEPFAGISGDMTLGALVDAGVSPALLKRELAKLKLGGYTLKFRKLKKLGVTAIKADVIIAKTKPAKHHHHRHYSDIKRMINSSRLAQDVKRTAIGIFDIIARAEAKIHGTTIDKVHFHEIGAIDSIVDIVGCAIGFHALGISQVHCSAVNTGSGIVKTAHGFLPIPAPATAEILTGIPVYSTGIEKELTTPTGAGIVAFLAGQGRTGKPLPPHKIVKTGYGAGEMDLPDTPNVLRITIAAIAGNTPAGFMEDEVYVIETNIDDMPPELYGHVMSRLFESGALDVTITPVMMKKNRPGQTLSVIIPADDTALETTAGLILAETSSFGIRYTRMNRKMLARKIVTVKTKYGPIRLKCGYLDGKLIKTAPEYDDVKKAAIKHNVPIAKVYSSAQSKTLGG